MLHLPHWQPQPIAAHHPVHLVAVRGRQEGGIAGTDLEDLQRLLDALHAPMAMGHRAQAGFLGESLPCGAGEQGLTTVIQAGPRFEILAENSIDEYTLASMAVADGQLFLRTAEHLYCLESDADQ